jgi:hypothetical protein
MRPVPLVGRLRRAIAPGLVACLAGCLAAASCASDVTRNAPTRGSLGTELYGVVCDRVGGQSLHEDLTGASFHAICHPVDGAFSSKVDTSQLPPMVDDQPDVHGNPVPLAVQKAQRMYGVARLERLAIDRGSLIAALDAAFPDVSIPVKDLNNPDPKQSCGPAAGGGQGRLHTELANLLGRFTKLYDDGTIPASTEAIGGVASVFNQSADATAGAQASWAHFNARAGYRPVGLALGTARALLAYVKLRDFANAVIAPLSPDSTPYATNPRYDAQGNRIAIPGSAYPKLVELMAAVHFELANETNDPVPSPLVLVPAPDGSVGGRTVLNRPRTDLEVLTSVLLDEDPTFVSGTAASQYIVKRDPRGYAALAPPGASAVPSPFVDEGDGLPKVDPVTGQFVTTSAMPAPSPFFAIGAADTASRDAAQRALGAGGQLLYTYVDTNQTFASRVVAHLRGVVSGKSLVDSSPSDNHETLMNVLAGIYALAGQRVPDATKTYGTQSLPFNGFRAVSSPLGDLVYALGQVLADPTADATLAFASSLMKNNAPDVARVVGDALWAKDQANADSSAKIPSTSTFWDEMIDLVVQIAQDTSPSSAPNGRRLLEDILSAFAQPASLGLSKALASQALNVDDISYDRANLNGPAVNVTTNGPGPPSTPADRTKPDSGGNRSQLQRFAQLVHDTNGVTMCNKEGAILHGQGLTVINTANACASTAGGSPPPIGQLCLPPDTSCTCTNARSFHECEVFKITNLASFYLDSLAKKASLYFRNKLIREGLGGPAGFGAVSVGVNEQSSGIGLHMTSGATDDTYNDSATALTGPEAPGFWDPVATVWNPTVTPPTLLRPKPAWLNRLAGFDLASDSTMPAAAPATNNYTTNHFLSDLQGLDIGTAVCPERLIADPCANDPNCFDSSADNDVSSDGMVHGLRSCPDGDWLYQRDKDSFFITEENGFLTALTPLASAFVNHGREDLFVQLMDTLHKHWQTAAGASAAPDECQLTANASCAKDGADTYEPLLGKIFSSDLLTSLNNLTSVASGMTIPTCSAIDATKHTCTTAGTTDGIALLAETTRALVDPAVAKSYGLTDSSGHVTSLRNDMSTNPQVTPLYLVLEALNEIDAAFAQRAQASPPDPDPNRQAEWRLARSQLVDEFLAVGNANMPAKTQAFADPALPKILPVLIDTLRAQLLARCGSDEATGKCVWARGIVKTPIMLPPTSASQPAAALWNEAVTTLSGPTFAASMDVLDALRRDPAARAAQEDLLQYLASPGVTDSVGQTESLMELLSSTHDILQVLEDDENLFVPVYQVFSSAFVPPETATAGRALADSTTALLTRIAGRAVDESAAEICASELDPNEVVSIALSHLVTPMPLANCTASANNPCIGETPLEVILDTIADVNRAPDSTSSELLRAADYASISNELKSFFLDPQRGLEQFYAIVRQGTGH